MVRRANSSHTTRVNALKRAGAILRRPRKQASRRAKLTREEVLRRHQFSLPVSKATYIHSTEKAVESRKVARKTCDKGTGFLRRAKALKSNRHRSFRAIQGSLLLVTNASLPRGPASRSLCAPAPSDQACESCGTEPACRRTPSYDAGARNGLVFLDCTLAVTVARFV